MVGLVICILLMYFVILHRFSNIPRLPKHKTVRQVVINGCVKEKNISPKLSLLLAVHFLTSLILVFFRQMQA